MFHVQLGRGFVAGVPSTVSAASNHSPNVETSSLISAVSTGDEPRVERVKLGVEGAGAAQVAMAGVAVADVQAVWGV